MKQAVEQKELMTLSLKSTLVTSTVTPEKYSQINSIHTIYSIENSRHTHKMPNSLRLISFHFIEIFMHDRTHYFHNNNNTTIK